MPQRIDRCQLRRLPRRIEPEEHADGAGGADRQNDGGRIHLGAPAGEMGDGEGCADAKHDPGETAGLDGLLKRLLDEPYGKVVVGLMALGLGAFGVYSVARAFVNRERAANTT